MSIQDITRSPTLDERKDFQDISILKPEDAKGKFEKQLGQEMQKAIKAKKPFAAAACRAEFEDYYKNEVAKSIRRNGFLNPADIKPLKVDFAKYSDLNNFDLIDEGEQSNENLTKHNPGLDVREAFKTYQFKGYSNKYVIMESGPEAIIRARQKLREIEAETPKKKVK